MMKNKLLFYICIFIFSALKGTEEGDPQESLHVRKCKKKVCLEYSHKKDPISRTIWVLFWSHHEAIIKGVRGI